MINIDDYEKKICFLFKHVFAAVSFCSGQSGETAECNGGSLVGDIHHFDMGTLLDRLGIAVRTGHHCAQPLMQRLGIEGTVRASFGLYNTKEEIDVLVAGIERVSKMF